VPDLEILQRWMQAVITHPEGVEFGIASAPAQRLIDVTSERSDSVVRPSQAMSGLERLAIYQRAYFARLLECLRDSYRVVLRAVGEEAFDEFAVDYLRRFPSRSYTLNDLGAEFPEYLRQSRPETDPEDTWPDFVVDLATLECLYNQVFDGPGVEGEPALSADTLQTLPLEAETAVDLKPAPCLHLLELRFPVHEYYSAVRRGDEASFPEPSETLLAVTRRDYKIRRSELSRPQFALLSALLQGDSLESAIEAGTEAARDLDRYAADLATWFRDWTAANYFGNFRRRADESERGR
jgi:hypothetical protein